MMVVITTWHHRSQCARIARRTTAIYLVTTVDAPLVYAVLRAVRGLTEHFANRIYNVACTLMRARIIAWAIRPTGETRGSLTLE